MQLTNSSTASQRATAALSTVVAIALLGAAVTAEHAGEPVTERLHSLESDLRYQLEMVYRAEPAVARERLAALDATLDAWRNNRQGEHDDRALAGWMRESILRSMPTERRELPPTPEFGIAAAPETAIGESATNESPRPPKIIVAITPPVDIRDSDAAARAAQAEKVARQPASSAAPEGRSVEPSAIAATPTPPQAPNRQQTPAAAPTIEQSSAVYTVEPAPTEHSVAKVVAQSPAPESSATSASEPIRVNLAELNARIRGYHAGIDELEASIEEHQDRLSQSTANALVSELEQLAAQREFIVLYYDGLTPAEHARVTRPRELLPTIKLAEKAIAAIKPADAGADFLASVAGDAEIQSLLRRLRAAAESSE